MRGFHLENERVRIYNPMVLIVDVEGQDAAPVAHFNFGFKLQVRRARPEGVRQSAIDRSTSHGLPQYRNRKRQRF